MYMWQIQSQLGESVGGEMQGYLRDENHGSNSRSNSRLDMFRAVPRRVHSSS